MTFLLQRSFRVKSYGFDLMLQDLLAQRFKLSLHCERREIPIYELAATSEVKLKPWVD